MRTGKGVRRFISCVRCEECGTTISLRVDELAAEGYATQMAANLGRFLELHRKHGEVTVLAVTWPKLAKAVTA